MDIEPEWPEVPSTKIFNMVRGSSNSNCVELSVKIGQALAERYWSKY